MHAVCMPHLIKPCKALARALLLSSRSAGCRPRKGARCWRFTRCQSMRPGASAPTHRGGQSSIIRVWGHLMPRRQKNTLQTLTTTERPLCGMVRGPLMLTVALEKLFVEPGARGGSGCLGCSSADKSAALPDTADAILRLVQQSQKRLLAPVSALAQQDASHLEAACCRRSAFSCSAP